MIRSSYGCRTNFHSWAVEHEWWTTLVNESWMMKLVILCVLWFFVRSQKQQPQLWNLQRAEADTSQIVFRNTTVTGKLMLCTWIWHDSLDGIWDTSIWLSLTNSSSFRGYLEYRDGYGNEILNVRWKQSPPSNITWKALFVNKFPPTSWNISSVYLNWGYRPTSEFSWNFYVSNFSFEPKPMPNKFTLTPIVDGSRIWLFRRKREVPLSKIKPILSPQSESNSAFNLIDLFSGNGIFAQVPQLLITFFTFFANLLPAQESGYRKNSDYSTEANAEVITQSTTTQTEIQLFTPRL